MPKRKRSEIEDTIDKIEDRAVRIKASRLQAKIDHGNQSLKTALNLARGFERQKLGRRQKQASNEPHTLLRLREEVIVLKGLDIGKTAHSYLFKQLVKTKRIRESAAFVALYGEDPKTEAPKGNAEANVLGRLFKANPVKEVVPGIMDSIKQVLNLDDPKSVNGDVLKSRTVEPSTDKTSKAPVGNDDDFAGFSDEQEQNEANGDEGSDDGELEKYNDLVAASDDSDASDIEDNELDPMEISDIEQDEIQGSISESQSDNSETGPPPSKPATPLLKDKLSSTAFLPSLSMGGYYSGSESDDDEPSNHNRGPAVPKDRKNRRGQRARQQLAELKYGKEAKHLQNQKPLKGKDGRSSGWDAKRGAVGDSGRFRKKKGPTGANGDVLVGDRMRARTKPAAKKKDEGPMHPSWEAARRKKIEAASAAFAGKKITFD